MINGNDIRRNPIFKKRRVEIFLSTGILIRGTGTVTKSVTSNTVNTTEEFQDSPTNRELVVTHITTTKEKTTVIPPKYESMLFVLTEVSDVEISSSAQTGTYTGAIASVIQPWYFQPVTITINGKSYMGAFDNDAYNIGVDNDVASIIAIREKINNDFARSDLASKLLVKISITNEPTSNFSNNGAVKQEFFGIIDDIRIREGEDRPYIQEYSLKFIGEYANLYSVKKGLEGLRQDFNRASLTSTDSVSEVTTGAKMTRAINPLNPRENSLTIERVAR
jgi:hypothetical protein